MSTVPYSPLSAPPERKSATRQDILKELRLAESDEASLLRHLHRIRDQKGLLVLRNLKARIMDLRSKLGASTRS